VALAIHPVTAPAIADRSVERGFALVAVGCVDTAGRTHPAIVFTRLGAAPNNEHHRPGFDPDIGRWVAHRAAVLVLNEETKRDRSRERNYVGLSRARDQLVVCGDPDFIREVGGPDLASRLNV